MKILNLQIVDSGITVRNINFNENGISFIFGDVEKKNEQEETSNSIGKSTLIDMIDFCFGSNSSFKNGLNGVILIATIKYKSNIYTVQRMIQGDKKINVYQSDSTIIDDIKNDKDFRKYFDIDRNAINLQFIKLRKKHVISQHNSSPKVSELVSFLDLLNLNQLATITQKTCDIQDEIKNEENIVKKILVQEMGIKNVKSKKIDNHIFNFKDKLESKEREEQNLYLKIQKLEVAEEYSDISIKRTDKLMELEQLSSEISLMEKEFARIDNVLHESNDNVLTVDKIINMLKRSKQELPNKTTKTLFEVEEFHKKVIEDRKNILTEQKEKINTQLMEKRSYLSDLQNECDNLGEVLSRHDAYQQALGLYKDVTDELQRLRYDEGKLSMLEVGSEKIKNYDENLTRCFADLQQSIKVYENNINEYRKFVNNLIKKLYGDNKTGYLDIQNREKHKKNKPIYVSLEIEHDSKGGVGQVKNNIIDYLIFNYNTQLEFLVQDSSCFAEVDPKQICTMLEVANEIAVEKNKQYIVAINKYELGEYEEYVLFAKEKQVITLSEAVDNKLMKRDYD